MKKLATFKSGSEKDNIPYADAIRKNGVYRSKDAISDRVLFLVNNGKMYVVGDGDPFYETRVGSDHQMFRLVQGDSVTLTFTND